MRRMILCAVMALAGTAACGGSDSKKVDADNTGKNARDRDSAAVTPLDQGNSAADLDMTKKIREAVVADEALSSNARNVKIITKDGAVTLRGPVKDAAEKARVVAIARNVAGQAPVADQLEVETQ